jgi:hypothetical protein
MKFRNIAIAAAVLVGFGSSRAHGSEQYASLAPVRSFSAYAYADGNSTSLGIDAQRAVDYVAGLLNQGGVATDPESGTYFQVYIYSTALRSIYDRAQVVNTHAVTIMIECFRASESGRELIWRDLNYGGYGGVSADYIVNEIQATIEKSVAAFCADYARDRSGGATAENAGLRRPGA